MKLLLAFQKYERYLDRLDTLIDKYIYILHESFRSRKNVKLTEDLEDQKKELLEKIQILTKDLQHHVNYMLQLLESQEIIDLEEINKLNRIHIDAMTTYRGILIKASRFTSEDIIQNSVKILKKCKEILNSNIEAYNKFLASIFKDIRLYTANEAILISKEEESEIEKNLDY